MQLLPRACLCLFESSLELLLFRLFVLFRGLPLAPFFFSPLHFFFFFVVALLRRQDNGEPDLWLFFFFPCLYEYNGG